MVLKLVRLSAFSCLLGFLESILIYDSVKVLNYPIMLTQSLSYHNGIMGFALEYYSDKMLKNCMQVYLVSCCVVSPL